MLLFNNFPWFLIYRRRTFYFLSVEWRDGSSNRTRTHGQRGDGWWNGDIHRTAREPTCMRWRTKTETATSSLLPLSCEHVSSFFSWPQAFMAHQSDRSSLCVYVLCIKPTNLTSHVGSSAFISRDGYRVATYLIMFLLVFDLVWVKEPEKFRVQTAVSAVCSFSKLWSQNNFTQVYDLCKIILNNLFSRNHCKN